MVAVSVNGVTSVVVAIGLVATSLLPGASGDEVDLSDLPAQVPAGLYTQLPDSADATHAPQLVVGRVADLIPDAEGNVAVFAELWPSAEVLAAQQPGDAFSRLPVARTESVVDGEFELRLDPASVPDAYVSSDGLLDVSITAWDNDTVAETMLTVAVDAETGLLVDPLSVSSLEESRKTTATGRVATRLTESLLAAPRVEAGSSAVREKVSADQSVILKATTCTTALTHRGMFQQAKIADGIPATGQKTKAKFTNSQTVTMGAAFSASGTAGSFSVSGEVSRSATFDQSFAEAATKRHYRVNVEIARYKDTCATVEPGYGGSGSISYRYYMKPLLLTGGTSTIAMGTSTSWGTCQGISSGEWTRGSSSGSAYSISGGLSLPSPASLSVKTKSQYNSSHSVTYIQGSGYQICGSNGQPALASRVHGKKA